VLQTLINKVKNLFFGSPIEIDPSNLELDHLPPISPDAVKEGEQPFYHPWHILTTQEKLTRILDRNYEAMDENSYRPVPLINRYRDWQSAKTNEQRKIYFEILDDAVDYYLQCH
jgi:hypothetical protein